MFTLNHRYGDTSPNHRYGDTSPLPVDWLARIASTIARLWFRSRRERHVRLVSAELQALDDRMLKDIGLQRYRIERVVLNGGRAEWYAPFVETGWPGAPYPKHVARCPHAA